MQVSVVQFRPWAPSCFARNAPWRLVTYVAFSDEQKAESFERYLKSGSGHAFVRKRLW
jgi:putative endonuclease